MPDPQVMACHPIFPQVKETSENLMTNETNVGKAGYEGREFAADHTVRVRW